MMASLVVSQNTQSVLSSYQRKESTFHLQSSWILNSGADIYVTNDLEDLYDVKPIQENLWSGNTCLRATLYGKAKVNLQTNNGPAFMVLKDVIYDKGFVSKLVSSSKLRIYGIYIDDLNSRL